MIDSFPIAAAVFIFVVFFILAMNWGVVNLLSSGLAALAGYFAFVITFHILPPMAESLMDKALTMGAVLGIAAGVGAFVFLVVRLVGGWLVKKAMSRGGWFHYFAEGVPGGICSFVPSFAIVLFLFTCIRVSGTQLELNYTDSISQDGLVPMADRIPPYPIASRWRNSVELVPGVAALMDFYDPFSNRANRNAAAFAIMGTSSRIRSYLLTQPQTADLAAHDVLVSLYRVEEVRLALESRDRVELVMAPSVQRAAQNKDLHDGLVGVELDKVFTGYIESLKPISTTTN